MSRDRRSGSSHPMNSVWRRGSAGSGHHDRIDFGGALAQVQAVSDIRPTVHVLGGLGNQLFQYFFGQVLAARSGGEAIYDTSGFETYKLHEGLGIEETFTVRLRDHAENERSALSSRPLLHKLLRRSAAMSHLLGVRTDLNFRLDHDPVTAAYYLGYWQSQPYTPEDLRAVRAWLRFRPEIQARANEIVQQPGLPLEKIAAVHVRRGDFVTARPPAPHYALPLDYYLSAMSKLQRELGVEHFIVGSDDPVWVDRFLGSRFSITNLSRTYALSGSYDLCSLASVPNKVISNSTFGWWAAVLGAEGGRVVAPHRWCHPGASNAEARKPLMPGDWRLLDA